MAAAAPAASDLERRKRVRLRLRGDLSVTPQKYEGRTYYVVKDPVSLRYYRFKEQEQFLLGFMDGAHTLDEAQKEYEKRFRPERLTLEDLEGFAQQLLTAGLVQNESPQAGKQLFDRRKKRKRSQLMQALTNILYIKIPIFDPDKLLVKMLDFRPLGFLPRGTLPLLLLVSLLLPLLLVATTLSHGVNTTLEAYRELVSPRAVGVLWGVLALVYLGTRPLRGIFTMRFNMTARLIMLGAVLLVLTHFETFLSKLPSYHEFFSFKTVVYLWVALGIVKIIHEFGHGLSCKYYGGEVHEMGFLFLVFSPALYCNVSDSWTLPSKWKRIIIAAAGIYVELLIAALATFVWWNTPTEPFINNMALSLMIVCSVSTVVFNANPLMRYDGYYVLADWIEIPNLRERSNKFLKNLFLEHCLGVEVQPEQYMALWRRWLFVIYAIASWIYRWVITFVILWFLYNFLKPYKLGVLSGMLALAALASMVGWPLYRLGKNIHQRGRLPDMKRVRVVITCSVLIGLIVAAFTVPLPVSRVTAYGVVELRPDAWDPVYVPSPPDPEQVLLLKALYVRDGQRVEANAPLADFQNRELERQYNTATKEVEAYETKRAALVAERAKITDPKERPRFTEEIERSEGDRNGAAIRAADCERRLKELTIHAPRGGIVMVPPTIDDVGKQWDRKKPLCKIGKPEDRDHREIRLQVLIPVTPGEYNMLKENMQGKEGPVTLAVSVRVKGMGRDFWQGELKQLPESEATTIPPLLSNRTGGPVAVKPGTSPDQLLPQTQQYLVRIDLVDPDAEAHPGVRARVKIHCRKRTFGWWLWWNINEKFNLGLL